MSGTSLSSYEFLQISDSVIRAKITRLEILKICVFLNWQPYLHFILTFLPRRSLHVISIILKNAFLNNK